MKNVYRTKLAIIRKIAPVVCRSALQGRSVCSHPHVGTPAARPLQRMGQPMAPTRPGLCSLTLRIPALLAAGALATDGAADGP